MNHGKGMPTGREALARKAAKAARPKTLVPKALGDRQQAKEETPWRSPAHLGRVVSTGCLVARRGINRTPCEGPLDPHHCRKIAPAKWGQPPDSLAVCLCRKHHGEAHEGPGGENGFQERYGINFVTWIERFSAPGTAEIAKIRQIRPHL